MVRAGSIISLAGLTVACGGGDGGTTPPPPVLVPSSMVATGTVNFYGLGGATFPATVHVFDQRNQSMAGAAVSFAASAGTVSPATATTDATGRATVQWTFPNFSAGALLTATIAGTELKATFTGGVTTALNGTWVGTAATTTFRIVITGYVLNPSTNAATHTATGTYQLNGQTFPLSGVSPSTVSGTFSMNLGGSSYVGEVMNADTRMVGRLNGAGWSNEPLTLSRQQ